MRRLPAIRVYYGLSFGLGCRRPRLLGQITDSSIHATVFSLMGQANEELEKLPAVAVVD
jgi:hypothetical protein